MIRFTSVWFPSLLMLASVSLHYFPKGETHRFAFYNVENLFDTVDDPQTDDSEFLPNGKMAWTEDRYLHKLDNLSSVFSAMDFPDLIGLSEIENETVLKDLTQTATMKSKNYGYVHYDSPDERGIDVALLYLKSNFKVLHSDYIRIQFPASIGDDKTRDILHVEGLYRGKDTLHIYVNHWPSRRDGAEKSAPKRIYVAQQLRKAVNAVLKTNPKSNVVIMGDFNDETDDKSIVEALEVRPVSVPTLNNYLYNTAAALDKKGEGTLTFKSDWNLFDQIIVSGGLLQSGSSIHVSESETIFKKEWMLYHDRKDNQDKPNRTYSGTKYHGGYSDHLPVYVDVF